MGVPFQPSISTFPCSLSHGYLGTDLASIPAEVPYLKVPERVPNRERITGLLSASEASIRMGLAWAGSPIHKRDSERSLPPAVLALWGPARSVLVHSFQLDPRRSTPVRGWFPLILPSAYFSDTAYALTDDLVITVDTAMAPGGVPWASRCFVWPSSVFPWMMGRHDTSVVSDHAHLSPTVSPGDWGAVISQMMEI